MSSIIEAGLQACSLTLHANALGYLSHLRAAFVRQCRDDTDVVKALTDYFVENEQAWKEQRPCILKHIDLPTYQGVQDKLCFFRSVRKRFESTGTGGGGIIGWKEVIDLVSEIIDDKHE
eukprot:scaffold93137_cov19-Tisochrysis_lutea.AAC.2